MRLIRELFRFTEGQKRKKRLRSRTVPQRRGIRLTSFSFPPSQTALENALDKKLLGGNLSKLEDSLGLTKVLEGLDLAKRQQNSRRHLTAPDGLLQGVGKLLAALEKALGVTALEDALDKVLPLVSTERCCRCRWRRTLLASSF